jgi:hypothetical protein
MAPSSGATDWAIHSSGRSKLTVFAGSVKVFHAAEVAAGPGDPEAEGSGAEGFDDGEPLVPVGIPPAPGLADVSGCAVHAELLPPGALHPVARAPVIRSAAARSPHDVALCVILPAYRRTTAAKGRSPVSPSDIPRIQGD